MTAVVMPAAAPVGVPAAAVAAPATAADSTLASALPFTELLRELVADAVPDASAGAMTEAVPAALPVTDTATPSSAAPAQPELVALVTPLVVATPSLSVADALPVADAPREAIRVGAKFPAAAALAQLPATAPSAPIAQSAALDAPAAQPVVTPSSAPATPAPATATATATSDTRPSSVAPHAQSLASASVQAAPASSPAAPADTAPAEVTLKLPNGAPAQWRQPLLQALGERLHVDVERGFERAVIRLDPPAMGSVEIVIRHQGGALQVQLTATHGEVLRQLHGIGESLRDGLVQRNFGEVSVQVSDATQDGSGRQRRGQAREDDGAPGRALGDETRTAFALDAERG